MNKFLKGWLCVYNCCRCKHYLDYLKYKHVVCLEFIINCSTQYIISSDLLKIADILHLVLYYMLNEIKSVVLVHFSISCKEMFILVSY